MGTRTSLPVGLCRFGPFEYELSKGELRKHGLRLHLQEQPSRVLAMLLERPGEVVTREELRALLWSSDTFVDFERSLNAAVAKLRQALADSAEQPLYVETVARHGYRFIAPLTKTQPSTEPACPGIATQLTGASSPYSGLIARRKPVKPVWLAATAIVAAAAFAAGYLLKSRRPPSNDPGVVRFVLSPPEGMSISAPNISPDGRTLVFAAPQDSEQAALWVRPLAAETAHRLEDTGGASRPFWSPDSQDIGFFADGKLKRISARRGSSQTLCDAPSPDGGAWNRDNIILFASTELYRVSASSGPVTQVTRLDKSRGEIRHYLPQFLPDGRTFVFWAGVLREGLYPAEESTVSIGSLDSPERKVLLTNRSRALFAAPDSLMFLRQGNLLAQKIDLKRWRTVGEPAAVPVNAPRGQKIASFSVSETGVLAYRVVTPRAASHLAWYTRDGRRMRTVGEPGQYWQMFLSPDEKMVALTVLTSDDPLRFNIWLLNLETSVLSRLTFGEQDADPVWSADSRTILYNARQPRGSGKDLMRVTLGERSPKLIYSDGKSNKSEAWSPDGRSIIYRRDEVTALTLAADGKGKPAVLFDTPYSKGHVGRFSLSPDGRWLAFMDSGTPLYSKDARAGPRTYVAEYPSMSMTRQVSSGFGCTPLWRSDGRELFYMAEHGEIMSVRVKLGATLEIGPPKLLFRPAGVDHESCFGKYGVSRDGQRFLVAEAPAPVVDNQIHVVMHWDAARQH